MSLAPEWSKRAAELGIDFQISHAEWELGLITEEEWTKRVVRLRAEVEALRKMPK